MELHAQICKHEEFKSNLMAMSKDFDELHESLRSGSKQMLKSIISAPHIYKLLFSNGNLTENEFQVRLCKPVAEMGAKTLEKWAQQSGALKSAITKCQQYDGHDHCELS